MNSKEFEQSTILAYMNEYVGVVYYSINYSCI